MERDRGERRLELLGLGAILILSLLLRLRHLDTFLPWFIFTDETRSTAVILHLIQGRTLNPDHFFHPALGYYLTALLYLAWAAVGQLGAVLHQGPGAALDVFNGFQPQDQLLIMLSRWVSLGFGLAAVVFCHLLCRLYLSWRWALLATLLFSINSLNLLMSGLGKDDTINLFLFVAGYWALVHYWRKGELGWLIAAAALASLVTATKDNYTLNVAVVVAVFLRWGRSGRGLFQVWRFRDAWVAAAVMFLAVFLATPYSLIHLQRTIVSVGWLYYQCEIISFYHTDPHVWWLDRYFYHFSVILPFTFGLPLFWTVVAGTIHWMRKRGFEDPVIVFPLIFFLYMFASHSGGKLGAAYAFYLHLCIVPLGCLFAANLLADLTGSGLPWKRATGIALAALVLVWSLLRMEVHWQEYFSAYDQLGPWLQDRPTARVLLLSVHEPTSALGLRETRAVWPQDFTEERVKSFDPDLIVIDNWAVAGFRKHYRDLWVAPLVDSYLSGRRGYRPVARFKPDYFNRGYYEALDPEYAPEVVVLERDEQQ